MNQKKWRPATGRRVNRLTSNNSIPRRVINVKASIPPVLFYLDELQRFEPRRESGWINSGLCPFHADKNVGSFSVNLDSGAFHCFSCGTAGADVVAFYRLKYCCDFMTALRDLEWRAGIWTR
jgi:hypothetical protein